MPFFGGVGIWEILLLVGLAVALFGAKRLPELGRSAGRSLRQFEESATGLRRPVDEVKEAITLDEIKDIAALRSPQTALSQMLLDKPKQTKRRTDT